MTRKVTCVSIMDGRFVLSNGVPSSSHMGYAKFAKHYLPIFEKVVIVARVFPPTGEKLDSVVGQGVEFYPVPAYSGPVGFIKNLPRIVLTLNRLIDKDSVYLLRVPGTIPLIFSFLALIRRVPINIECVADPADQMAAGSMRHPLRPFFRSVFITTQKWLCARASTATYVTREALQKRYPTRGLSHSWTDIVLRAEDYVPVSREKRKDRNSPEIIHVGMMTQLYKGHDTLIQAIKLLIPKFPDISVNLVGDGHYMAELKNLVNTLGIEKNIKFSGRLRAGEEIYAALDRADIFVLPSRQEGLPRAVLEAMARGLPCVTSDVGGLPELIESQHLVKPNDSESLALAIEKLWNSEKLMSTSSHRNLEVAHSYSFQQVQPKRLAFYADVKNSRARNVS